MGKGARSLLDHLLKRGGVSQAELSAFADISQPQVARLVKGFQEEGLVELSNRKAQRPGNPSVHVALNPEHAYSLGIALTGDAVAMSLLDFAGRERASARTIMESMAPAKVLKELHVLRRRTIKLAAVDPTRIVGAGVGFSGSFVGEPARFNPATPLREWADLDVGTTIAKSLDMPVLCDNEGTTASIAESLLGIGRHCGTFAYFYLTNGFGGGLIVDGRAARGHLGNAGDFGGVFWLLGGPYPGLNLMRELVKKKSGRDYSTVEEMVQNIDLSTPGVSQWIEVVRDPIAKLAFILGHTLAPEKVVIGGRLPREIARALAERIVLPQTPPRNDLDFPLPAVVATEVTGDPVAIGAAMMPLRQHFFV